MLKMEMFLFLNLILLSSIIVDAASIDQNLIEDAYETDQRMNNQVDTNVDHTTTVLLNVQKKGGSRLCSGTIITDIKILTTASCIEQAHTIFVQAKYTEGNFQQTIRVDYTNIKIHPQYDPVEKTKNLALVFLNKDNPIETDTEAFQLPYGTQTSNILSFHPFLRLSYANTIYKDDKYFVIGPAPSTFYSLGELEVSMTRSATCNTELAKEKLKQMSGDFPNVSEYCIKTLPIQSYQGISWNTCCQEDEGAPVLLQIKDGTRYLIGIVHYNQRNCSEFTSDVLKTQQSATYSFIIPIVKDIEWIKQSLNELNGITEGPEEAELPIDIVTQGEVIEVPQSSEEETLATEEIPEVQEIISINPEQNSEIQNEVIPTEEVIKTPNISSNNAEQVPETQDKVPLLPEEVPVTTESPTTIEKVIEEVPEVNNETEKVPEVIDEIEKVPEVNDEIEKVPEVNDEIEKVSEVIDEIEKVPEVNDEIVEEEEPEIWAWD